MTSELILMLIGVLIGALPFIILYGMANRRARDWQQLAELSVDSHDRTLDQLIRVGNYVQVLQSQMREWRVEDGEEWKLEDQ